MKNGGQITMFVVVGMFILAVVILMIYLFSGTKKGDQFEVLNIEQEALEAKEYIVSCLDDGLKDAVSHCSGNFPGGGPKCPNYEQDIADRVMLDFCDCIPNCNDFSIFKNVQVEQKGDMSITAKISEDKKRITVTMEYPILFKKGKSETLLGTKSSPFVAQYMLEQTDCVKIKLIDDDYQRCEADEEKTLEVNGLILTYKIGDKVVIGDVCIAC